MNNNVEAVENMCKMSHVSALTELSLSGLQKC